MFFVAHALILPMSRPPASRSGGRVTGCWSLVRLMGRSRITVGAADRQSENKPSGQHRDSQSPALEGILHSWDIPLIAC
jgi:hypothetical protein